MCVSFQNNLTLYNIMDPFPIYKVKLLTGLNNIRETYVFNGKNEILQQQQQLDNIIYTGTSIHIDDSIETIKLKIMMAMKKKSNNNNDLRFNDLYLFCQRKEQITTRNALSAIAVGDNSQTRNYNKRQFINYFTNIDQYCLQNDCSVFVPDIEDKDSYNYNTILQFQLDGKTFIVDDLLGRSSKQRMTDIVVWNPFKTTDTRTTNDEFKLLLRQVNDKLLLDSGNLVDNTIYLCLKEDVKNKDYFVETVNHYNMYSKLAEFEQIDMYYDLYNGPHPNSNIGIKQISLTSYPKESEVTLPVNELFKAVHATRQVPLIIYRLKTNYICRLFSNTKTVEGEKIPFMNHSKIEKATKLIDDDSIVFTIEYANDSYIYCQINRECQIKVKCDFGKSAMREKEVLDLILKYVNPVIDGISNIIEHTGYQFSEITSLKDPLIKINNILLSYEISQKGKGKTTNHNTKFQQGDIFHRIFYQQNNDKNGEFYFKRVSSFNPQRAANLFFTKINDKPGVLQLNFPGIEKFNKVNEDGVEKIKMPGFPVYIHGPKYVNENESYCQIEVNGINNILYLDTLQVYLNSYMSMIYAPQSDLRGGAFDSLSSSSNSLDIAANSSSNESDNNDLNIAANSSSSDDDDENLNIAANSPANEGDNENMKIASNESDNNDLNVASNKNDNNDLNIASNESDNENMNIASNESDNNDFKIASNESENENMNIAANESDNENINIASSESDNENINIASNESDNDNLNIAANDDDNLSVGPNENDNNKVGSPLSSSSSSSSYFSAPSDVEEEETDETEKKIEVLKKLEIEEGFIKDRIKALLKQNKNPFKNIALKNVDSIKCEPKKRPLVAVSEDEMNQLKETDPENYDDDQRFLKNPNKDNEYFVCPKYLSILTEKVIPDNEMQTNEKGEKVHPIHGKVLNVDYNGVQEGHYVFERKQDNLFLFPGLQKNGKPCCFTRPQQTETKSTEKNQIENTLKFKKIKQLEQKRWQDLPKELNKYFKGFVIKGVENSDQQSFIACIAYCRATEEEKIASIKEMKKTILEYVTLDKFITYQNGNLVTDFQDNKMDLQQCAEKMDFFSLNDKIKSSNLFQKLDMNNLMDQKYFQLVLSAYANFHSFLMDDDAFIDYTYLWDIVSEMDRLNLVIFEIKIKEKEKEKEINIVCPTNHFANSFFDDERKTIFLLKKVISKNKTIFEPLCHYNEDKDKIVITKSFHENNKQDKSYDVNKIMKLVKQLLIQCKPVRGSNLYQDQHFKSPILLSKLIDFLSPTFKIIQVLDYNNKVNGIKIIKKSNPSEQGFVPCYPSSLIKHASYDYEMVTKINNLFQTYDKTVAFLQKLSNDSHQEIPCKPLFTIQSDDGNVVGILTESNQFVQITDISRFDETIHNLPLLDNYSYLLTPESTVPLLLSNKTDDERSLLTRRYKLENEFYQSFKSTLKILLNDFSKTEVYVLLERRKGIEDIIYNMALVYTTKIKQLVVMLKEILSNAVVFSDIIDGDQIYDILQDDSLKVTGSCIKREEGQCNNPCSLLNNKNDYLCQLIIPKTNLITGKNNEIVYYKKVADELLRYSQSRNFFLNPKMVLTVNYDETNAFQESDNEMIKLYPSDLTTQYFSRLVPAPRNKYVTYNSIDEVNPPQEITSSHFGGETKKNHTTRSKKKKINKKTNKKTLRKR